MERVIYILRKEQALIIYEPYFNIDLNMEIKIFKNKLMQTNYKEKKIVR